MHSFVFLRSRQFKRIFIGRLNPQRLVDKEKQNFTRLYGLIKGVDGRELLLGPRATGGSHRGEQHRAWVLRGGFVELAEQGVPRNSSLGSPRLFSSSLLSPLNSSILSPTTFSRPLLVLCCITFTI